MKSGDDSDRLEAVWQIWCAPLVARSREIEQLLQQNDPSLRNHPLARPGLDIHPGTALNAYCTVRLNMEGCATLWLECKPTGIWLTTHIALEGEPDDICLEVIVDKPWAAQHPRIKEHWQWAFGDALRMLDAAIDSFRNKTPLADTRPWPVVLTTLLQQECDLKRGHSWETWVHWTRQWGTVQMKDALDLVHSLVDPRMEFFFWRESLLTSWKNIEHVAAVDAIPSSIFETVSLEP